MTSQHPAPEDSLALAMIELDRLERERQDEQNLRNELHATARRQAHDIVALERALQAAWPRAIARQRRRASREHRRSRDHQLRLRAQVEREHAERLAELDRQNAERRAALGRLERETVEEFNPARRALEWLAPFAAASMVAALGFLLVQQPEVAAAERSKVEVPLAAVAEPSGEPSEDRPVTLSDAVAPAIEQPAIPSAPEPASAASKKPSKRPSASKPATKPATKPASKPATKPATKPIVLVGGDDPLGSL
ncbi:hypothetical protein ACNOYE_02820 [Nannocystaceae bacterium ST9]